MKYIIFTLDCIGASVGKKLLDERQDVLIAQVQDKRELLDGKELKDYEKELKNKDEEEMQEFEESERRRLSVYDGIVPKKPAQDVLKFLKKLPKKERDNYFIWFDFNNLGKLANEVVAMGYEKGLFPTPEDLTYEDDRKKMKEFVRENYPDVIVAEDHEFDNVDDALEFLEETDKIWVLKGNDECAKTKVPMTNDPEKCKFILSDLLESHREDYEKGGFILEEKIVDGYELTPEIIFWNGKPVMSTLDIENKPKEAGNVGIQLGCFDRETDIMTDRGWKKFYELDIKNDLVANLDYENNKVIYSPILDYIQYNYKGKMHLYKTKHMDVCITPNHRLWGQIYDSADRKLEVGFVESKNLGNNECVLSPIKYFNDKISEDSFIIEDEIIQYSGRNDNGIVTKTLKGDNLKFIDWARFLGLWMAEGFISKDCNNKFSIVGISQSKKENLPICFDIIKKINTKWSRTKNSWVCGKSTLANHLLKFSGKGTYDKRVPQYIKNSSKEIIKSFLDGFAIGDGSVQNSGTICLYTVNKGLADDLMELCIKAGYWSSILERQPRMWYIRGKSGWSKKQYEVMWWMGGSGKRLKNIMFSKNKRFSEVDFDDDVFCVTTKTQVILTRRNGKAVWIGNCSQNLIISTELEDKINKIAFPPIVYEMAKKRKGMSIYDAGLIMKDGCFYFTETCSMRVGYDSFFTDLEMCGSATNFFESLVDGINPIQYKFGAAVRGLNEHKDGKCRRVLEDIPMKIGEGYEANTWVYELKKDEDDPEKMVCTGNDWDLVVFTGHGDTVEDAVDMSYEAADSFIFDDMAYRPKFDFMSFDYISSIPNRYHAGLEAELYSGERVITDIVRKYEREIQKIKYRHEKEINKIKENK